MAERSTARSTDGAAQDHDEAPSVRDGWIARRSRLEVSDADEQYGSAYRQHEHAHRRPDPLAYPERAYYEPDQTYQEERRAQGPYGPTDAYPIHDDTYVAQQERYARPEEDCAHEEHPHDDDARRSEYRSEESGAHGPDTDEGGRPRRKHNRELGARPGPASWRRLWLIPVSGLALGALLCALAFTGGSGRPQEDGPPLSAATNPADPLGKPTTVTEMPSMSPSSATPHNSSATPSVTPSATPTATPSVTPTATPSVTPSVTPTQTQSADPVLLGPSNRTGVENMVQRYCDRHTGGSADPRDDGRWQCKRLLSVSIVDMDVACRNTYDSGAYARASNSDDPYAWRCYH